MPKINNPMHRKRIVNILVYSSVMIILVAVGATLFGSDMTHVAAMYAAFVGMVSLVVVGHFATKPEKNKEEGEEGENENQ